MKKELWIEKLRVIATMAVVMQHVIGGTYVSNPSNVPQYRVIFDCDLLIVLTKWAVPVFLMITGYFLLDPNKELSGAKIEKYIKRMLWVLLTFGLGYCLIESYVNYIDEGIGKVVTNSLINLITGNSWDHMWYVYMLIGIYAVTPIIKAFINNSSDKGLKEMLLRLFVMTIVLTTIKCYTGINVSNFYMFDEPYLFYYMFGYCISKIRISAKWWMLLGSVASICMSIVVGVDITFKDSVFRYNGVCVAVLAMSIFAVGYNCSKNSRGQQGMNWVVEFLSKRSFCIYLVHTFFLNLMYKGLNMYPTDLPIAVGESVYLAIALVGSFIAYEILSRIPFIKKII